MEDQTLSSVSSSTLVTPSNNNSSNIMAIHGDIVDLPVVHVIEKEQRDTKLPRQNQPRTSLVKETLLGMPQHQSLIFPFKSEMYFLLL